MWKYIVKRLLLLIPVVIGVTFLVFVIMNLKPGDPGRMILGLSATQEAVEKYNTALGLDRPFLVRYLDYMSHLIRGDFGLSWYGSEPILPNIVQLFPATLKICLLSIIFAMVVGIPLGVLSAVKQYSLADRIASTFAMIMASVPTFWLCLLMTLFFAVRLKLLPSFGLSSWKHYIMPMIALGANTLGLVIRMTRSSMLEEIRQDYVRTARAKGAKEKTVIFTHALRNSLIPVVTACGTNFSLLLGGTVFVEAVFAIPGLGNYLVDAVTKKDIPVVMGCVVILAISVVIINLGVDIIYAFLDPRIKSKYQGSVRKSRRKAVE